MEKQRGPYYRPVQGAVVHRTTTANMPAQQKQRVVYEERQQAAPQARAPSRRYPERFTATVHTPPLLVDDYWIDGGADMVCAMIDDAIADALNAIVYQYGVSIRIISIEKWPVVVQYEKRTWMGKTTRFPVMHLILTVLTEEIPN